MDALEFTLFFITTKNDGAVIDSRALIRCRSDLITRNLTTLTI